MSALRALLEEESAFETRFHQWRPSDIFEDYVARGLLRVALRKKALVLQSLPEISRSVTGYAQIYKASKRMELRIRQALIHLASDKYLFLRALSFFYEDYKFVVESLYRARIRGETT